MRNSTTQRPAGGLPRGDAAAGAERTFERFRTALDQGLARLAATSGRDFSGVVTAYNTAWPDGRKMKIVRLRDGGFTVRFSDGGVVRLPDWNALGTAALLMRDAGIYAAVQSKHE